MIKKKQKEKKEGARAKDGVRLETKIRRIQYQHLKRKGLEIEEVECTWSENTKRLAQLVLFESNDGETLYFVEVRGEGGLISSTFRSPTASIEEAYETYNKTLDTKKKVNLQGVYSYYHSAKQFILKQQEVGARGDYGSFSNRFKLGFILALSELLEEGFYTKRNNGKEVRFDGHRSGKSKNFFRDRKARNRRILATIGDIDFYEGNIDLDRDISQGFENFLKTKQLKEKTFDSYVFALVYAVRQVFMTYPRVYENWSLIETSTLNARELCLKKFLATAHNKEGQIKRSGHFPMIPIESLDEILDIALDTSIPIFNSIILGLSTMVRPTELWRLTEDPEAYITDNFFLDYKSEKLSIKTSGKVSIDSIENPMLSLISLVLMKYKHPLKGALSLDDFFAKKPGESFFRHKKGLNYFQRSLRTTGGHMLAFCEKAKDPHRANYYDVKSRMGHATISQAVAVYAKKSPVQGKTPESYLQTKGIMKNGVLISENQPLWDVFLLKKWIQGMKKKESESNMKIIWNQIMSEHKALKKINDSETDESVVVDEL